MDKLGYCADETCTSFKLAAGTALRFGPETIILDEDVSVTIGKALSRDAVVETVIAAGASQANAGNFAYTEKRDGATFDVTYGGRGQRYETERPTPEPKAEPKAAAKKTTKK